MARFRWRGAHRGLRRGISSSFWAASVGNNGGVAKGDTDGYAVFGHVVDGIENVVKVLDAPTSPTAGEGAMKGQMIEAPITIVSARRMP
jgi:cyclophilin family peptidyl-prolyl cis-trans isomerase